jgi:DsbC/DsbD-like thiol-disulfide interchange protein
MLIRRLLLMAGLVALSASGARAASHVQATVMADASAVAAGKPFTLGVLLKVDPGWHIYWKNPGDAGLATKVIWTLPAGFSAGELQYPTPEKFVLPGNIVCYGYENSVMLLTRVTPGAGALPAEESRFSGKVSWLVCADVCIPGSQTVELSLPNSVPSPINEDLFKTWQEQVPTDAKESADVASCTIEPVAQADQRLQTFAVDIGWKTAAPGDITFFPGAVEGYNVENVDVQSGAGKTRITLVLRPLAGKYDLASVLNAVVGYNAGNGRRGVNVAIAIPQVSKTSF